MNKILVSTPTGLVEKKRGFEEIVPIEPDPKTKELLEAQEWMIKEVAKWFTPRRHGRCMNPDNQLRN